ncbi:MAG: Cytochrome [Gammaproteobacteria bacterium]|nr:Cytochrome [Gammaproteobacteria bacterium]
MHFDECIRTWLVTRHEDIVAVPQLPRIAKKETVLGGKTIPQGAFVFLCWASGNRDPQRFAEPRCPAD